MIENDDIMTDEEFTNIMNQINKMVRKIYTKTDGKNKIVFVKEKWKNRTQSN